MSDRLALFTKHLEADTSSSTRVQQLRTQHAYSTAYAMAQAPRQLDQANFAKRSFRDKQTALILAQFANENKDLAFGSDRVETLVGTLIVSCTCSYLSNHDVSLLI